MLNCLKFASKSHITLATCHGERVRNNQLQDNQEKFCSPRCFQMERSTKCRGTRVRAYIMNLRSRPIIGIRPAANALSYVASSTASQAHGSEICNDR